MHLERARSRFLAALLPGLLIHASPAHAGDVSAALDMVRVPRTSGMSGEYFGISLAGGDVDGDGYSDLVVSAHGEASVSYGSPSGVEGGYATVFAQQYDYAVDAGYYGSEVATIDLDADGNHEVLVAAGEIEGAVFVYQSGPSGVLPSSESLLVPLDPGAASPFFGYALADAGDVDGDGVDEVLVGADVWAESNGPNDRIPGTAFLYTSNGSGVDVCSEQRIAAPASLYGSERALVFGTAVSSAGDMDNDGYGDIAVTCAHCAVAECEDCAAVVEWSGGSAVRFDDASAHVLSISDPPPSGTWNSFGASLSPAGHLDGDDYEDLIVGSQLGGVVFYGSPAGPDPARLDRGGLLDDGLYVAGIGDLDADGFDDVLLGGFGNTVPTVSLHILFGSEAGIDTTVELETPGAPTGYDFGRPVAAIGDVNGDGRVDMVGASHYEDGGDGAVYVISPVCTWYLDADEDGYGDPASSVADCHDQPGYVARPDDCDDADAAIHGSVWYPDLDGDGYGTKAAGGTLACSQPENTASTWTDCDDTNAARSPEGVDDTVDGVDQDCDEHDGTWDRDSGDCPEDTGDTGDTAPVDTGDSGADTGDTAPDSDSADTAPVDSAAPNDDEPGPPSPADPDCGCAESPYAGRNSMWVSGVLSVAVLTRRRRGPTPA